MNSDPPLRLVLSQGAIARAGGIEEVKRQYPGTPIVIQEMIPEADFYDDVAGVAGAGMYLPVEPDPETMAVDINPRPYVIAAVLVLIVIGAIWYAGA